MDNFALLEEKSLQKRGRLFRMQNYKIAQVFDVFLVDCGSDLWEALITLAPSIAQLLLDLVRSGFGRRCH